MDINGRRGLVFRRTFEEWMARCKMHDLHKQAALTIGMSKEEVEMRESYKLHEKIQEIWVKTGVDGPKIRSAAEVQKEEKAC